MSTKRSSEYQKLHPVTIETLREQRAKLLQKIQSLNKGELSLALEFADQDGAIQPLYERVIERIFSETGYFHFLEELGLKESMIKNRWEDFRTGSRIRWDVPKYKIGGCSGIYDYKKNLISLACEFPSRASLLDVLLSGKLPARFTILIHERIHQEQVSKQLIVPTNSCPRKKGQHFKDDYLIWLEAQSYRSQDNTLSERYSWVKWLQSLEECRELTWTEYFKSFQKAFKKIKQRKKSLSNRIVRAYKEMERSVSTGNPLYNAGPPKFERVNAFKLSYALSAVEAFYSLGLSCLQVARLVHHHGPWDEERRVYPNMEELLRRLSTKILGLNESSNLWSHLEVSIEKYQLEMEIDRLSMQLIVSEEVLKHDWRRVLKFEPRKYQIFSPSAKPSLYATDFGNLTREKAYSYMHRVNDPEFCFSQEEEWGNTWDDKKSYKAWDRRICSSAKQLGIEDFELRKPTRKCFRFRSWKENLYTSASYHRGKITLSMPEKPFWFTDPHIVHALSIGLSEFITKREVSIPTGYNNPVVTRSGLSEVSFTAEEYEREPWGNEKSRAAKIKATRWHANELTPINPGLAEILSLFLGDKGHLYETEFPLQLAFVGAMIDCHGDRTGQNREESFKQFFKAKVYGEMENTPVKIFGDEFLRKLESIVLSEDDKGVDDISGLMEASAIGGFSSGFLSNLGLLVSGRVYSFGTFPAQIKALPRELWKDLKIKKTPEK